MDGKRRIVEEGIPYYFVPEHISKFEIERLKPNFAIETYVRETVCGKLFCIFKLNDLTNEQVMLALLKGYRNDK